MSERIIDIKRRKGCNSLVMLGDIKDSIIGLEPKSISSFNSFLSPLIREFQNIAIVPGNHDGGIENMLPSSISIASSKGLLVKDDGDEEERKIALLHGHAFPGKKLEEADIFVIGHMHLMLLAGTKAEPLWAKVSFIMNEERKDAIILPPFNELLTGYMLRAEEKKKSSFADFILRNAVKAESFLLDGTAVGEPSKLRDMLEQIEY